MTNIHLKVALPVGATGGRWELVPDVPTVSQSGTLSVTTAWGLIGPTGDLKGQTLSVGAAVTLPTQAGTYGTLRILFKMPLGVTFEGLSVRVELKETSAGVMDIPTLINGTRATVVTPPAPTFTPAQAAPPPAVVIAPPAPVGTITSTAKGSVLGWTPDPVGQYHVYRSVESAAGYPELTFYRLTTAPITAVSFKDLFLYEGESARYRVMVQPGNGNPSLHVQMDVTQVSYGTGDALMTVTNTGNSSTAVNIIENKVFITSPGQIAINFSNTSYKYLIRNCIFLGSGTFIQQLSGVPYIEIENCIGLGQKPGAGNANKSVGVFFTGSYTRYFASRQSTVRGMGGIRLSNYRGADTNRPIDIHGCTFWNLNRKRVDSTGAYIKSDWSSIFENPKGSGVTNVSNAGVVEVVGRDVVNALQIDNSGAQADGLTAACVGGMDMYANLMVGEPGRSAVEDAINFYQAGGESLAKPNKVRVWCVMGNPSSDINFTPGGAWNMGQIKTPAGYGYNTQSGPSIQSQSAGLLSDSSPSPKKYENYGSYTAFEDVWAIGIGVQVSVQAGHGHSITRLTTLGTRQSLDGLLFTNVTGGTNSNPSFIKYDNSNASDTGTVSWNNNVMNGYRGILPDSFNIGTRIAGSTYPFGMDDKDLYLAGSSDNSAVKRDATLTEAWAGYHAFLDKCASIGVTRLGVVPA